jgi:hypothetical protein
MQRKQKATAQPWLGLVFGMATVSATGATAASAAAAAAAKKAARISVRGAVAWNVNLFHLGAGWMAWEYDGWDRTMTARRADGSESVAPLDSVAVVEI